MLKLVAVRLRDVGVRGLQFGQFDGQHIGVHVIVRKGLRDVGRLHKGGDLLRLRRDEQTCLARGRLVLACSHYLLLHSFGLLLRGVFGHQFQAVAQLLDV